MGWSNQFYTFQIVKNFLFIKYSGTKYSNCDTQICIIIFKYRDIVKMIYINDIWNIYANIHNIEIYVLNMQKGFQYQKSSICQKLKSTRFNKNEMNSDHCEFDLLSFYAMTVSTSIFDMIIIYILYYFSNCKIWEWR